jgi:hypothetical protein
MAALITRVRTLIGDADESQFTDDQVEDFLDDHRRDEFYRPLSPVSTVSGGVTVYLRYEAGVGHWETDAALVDGDYEALTPDTSDYIRGVWTFAASTPGPVYLTGSRYDLYGAAADALRAWLATLKLQFDFTADGATFHANQQVKTLEQMIARYDAQAETAISAGTMVRGDVDVRGWPGYHGTDPAWQWIRR